MIACADIAANETFGTEILGLKVSDWAGDACFVGIDDAHHCIALTLSGTAIGRSPSSNETAIAASETSRLLHE